MKRILFVDDERCFLDGIRRVVRPMRNEWLVDFADSGDQAIALARADPYDVIVSDMKMPGLCGVDVLRAVRERSPATVRVILSGQSDRDQILKAIPYAHQFLTKPCDSDLMLRTLHKALRLGGILGDPVVARLCSGFGALPSIPATYLAIVEEMNRGDASLEEIGRIVGQDVAMSAKVLQLVNSSFFGLAREVTSPAQAVTYLGLETMRALALQIGVFAQVSGPTETLACLGRVNERSTVAATLARRIGQRLRLPTAVVDPAFTGALLSGVGYVVLAHGDPQRFPLLLAELEAGTPPVEAEKRVFGATATALGAYLLGLWGLPGTVIEVVADHREPPASADDALGPVGLVHVACLLADHGDSASWRDALDAELVTRTGIGQRIDEIGTLLGGRT